MSTAFWLNLIVLLLIYEDYTLSKAVEQCSCTDVCGEKNKELLGQGTWRLLHEMVDNVERTDKNEKLFQNLVLSLEHLYPCAECRAHIKEMKLSRDTIEMTPKFMCEFHNKVNKQLEKELYNCDNFTKYFLY